MTAQPTEREMERAREIFPDVPWYGVNMERVEILRGRGSLNGKTCDIQQTTGKQMSRAEFYDRLAAALARVRAEEREAALREAAEVVDQCNREGPYNAIGAASRIRALIGDGNG